MVKNILLLLTVRLTFVTAAFILGSFLLRVEPSPFYYIIALLYFLTVFYAILLIKKVWLSFSIYLQLIVDVVLETAVIHYSGGVDSVFVFLYIATVVFSSFVLSHRAVGIITGVSVLCYSSLVSAEFYGLIPAVTGRWSSYNEGGWSVLYIVSFRMVILGFAGYLSSYLSKRLSEKTVELFKVKSLSDRVMEVMTGGVITADRSDRIMFANNAGADILGITMNNLIGTDWKEIFRIGENYYLIKEDELAVDVDVPVRAADGKTKIFKVNISYLCDEKENPTGKVIVFHDVTEILDLKRKVQQNEKLVIMGELAGGIAHEIRNPLASICGSIELLKEKVRFDRKEQKLIDIILKESDHLNQIIEEFLYYSKGKPKDLRTWNLNAVIGEVVMVMKNSPGFQGDIKLIWKDPGGNILVMIDAEQIKQVLINLINNAVDAMPEGGGKIEIFTSVSSRDNANSAEIKVRDNGMGMTKDILRRIFEPFFSTKESGYGIGLAICRKIIESHNGTIDAESERGTGTEFKISLPLAK